MILSIIFRFHFPALRHAHAEIPLHYHSTISFEIVSPIPVVSTFLVLSRTVLSVCSQS